MKQAQKNNCKNKKIYNQDIYHKDTPQPIHKQFQLLYRSRDNLPSSTYQSLIFMKSKKCPDSIPKNKKNLFDGKPSTGHLKNMIRNLQKEIKIQQNKQRKNKKSNKIIKSNQINIVSNANINLKNQKYKSAQDQKNKKNMISSRKENIKYAIPLPQSKQYILIGDQFISTQNQSIADLQDKLYASYRPDNTVNSKKRMQALIQQSKENSQQQILELQSVQSYITNKVIKIQRWWRQMLSKINQKNKSKSNKDLSEDLSYKILGGCNNLQDMVETVSHAFDSSENIQQQPLILKNIDNTLNNNKISANINYEDTLQLRSNAAKIQLNTHKSILMRLLETQKIQRDTYETKYKQIQSNYEKQMTQIKQIRDMLRKNAQRAQKIVKKTKQDIYMAESVSQLNQQQILQKIFGNESQGRQKSTGCHFSSSPGRHYFQKQKYQQFSQEQSQSQDDKKLSQNQQAEFYQQNHQVHSDFMVNANFKQLLEQYKERQNIKVQIQQRIALQMGMIGYPLQQSLEKPVINTSITGIHQFLVTFFKFYTHYYKQEFIRFINMPYGHSPQHRLAFMQNYDDLLDEDNQQGIIYGLQSVIGNQVLEDFHQHYYEYVDDPSQIRLQTINYDKIHNKAIFDSFNEALNYFRPYYVINGPPYIWNNSEKALTFYFISQENIREVFEKTQFRVLKWASSLCGIMMSSYEKKQSEKARSLQQALLRYRQCTHPVIVETRQEKMYKTQKIEIEQQNYSWFIFQQERTSMLYQLSTLMLEQVIMEAMKDCFPWMDLEGNTSPMSLQL